MSSQQSSHKSHTPLPFDVAFGRDAKSGWQGLSIVGAGGVHIANLVMQITDNERANAAFIVTACNQHDALVAALKGLLAAADHTLPADWRQDRPVSLAKSAIALAEST